jgi:serine/threonine protein kinase
MAQLILAGEFVGPGEERSAQTLERDLPGSWVVICNKELVNRDGSTREVDFVVVGQHAVFVVEEKSWAGPIHGNENGWVLRSGESYASPISITDANARRLAGMLRSSVPGLSAHTTARHFVFGRVVLSSEKAEVFVHDPRKNDGVLRLQDAAHELIRFDHLQGVASISSFRGKIVERLTSLQDRPKVPRTVGDYDILEAVAAVGPVREFRARHADGSERLLKLVPRPTTLDPERRRDAENRLLREYNALKQLADVGRAPAADLFFSWDQGNQWVIPMRPINGRTLRADRTAAPPEEARALEVATEAFEALVDVHRAGVVHRALNPDRVHLTHSGKVAFSSFVVARIEGAQSVASTADEFDPEDTYRAPECRVDMGLADPRSDVYSLAASLTYWIDGQEPEPGAAPPVPDPGREIDDERTRLARVLADCLTEDERRRPLAEPVAERLRAILVDRDRVLVAPTSPRSGLTDGEAIDGQHRIIRRLGHGGSAITYLAEDEVAGGLFVLKTIVDAELVGRLTRNEFAQLRDLNHPNLPRVYDVRPASHAFHLKIEYAEGSSLKQLAAERTGDRALVCRVGQDVLAALAYLHERNRWHRDVAPGNIVVPDAASAPVRLIDFGLATEADNGSGSVGTPRYRPPEVDRLGRWSPQGDLYSLGVVLFELFTGRLPYVVEDQTPRKSQLLTASSQEKAQFGPILRVLLQAVDPDAKRRFQTATEFAVALRDAAEEEPASAVVGGKEQINPTVAALRALYRNSRLGNADNRGMDTPFAEETYVPTRLDEELLPAIRAGTFRLVVLSGNPGDGKTAFLQRVKEELKGAGGSAERVDDAGWRIRLEDRVYAALNDASESDGQRSADDLMHEVLAPLRGRGQGAVPYTALVAANDGRLLDFFERFGQEHYPGLTAALMGKGDAESADSVVLVDLKHRSVVGYKPGEPSLFSELVKRFVARERWEVCEDCVARASCPMRFNALSLQPAADTANSQAQLHRLLLAVHLRRERRPTIRDLRSALAFLITHDTSCQAVHAERHEDRNPLARTERLYFDAAFNGSGGPDLLLDTWREMDPADIAEPALDRQLYLRRGDPDADTLSGAFAAIPGRPTAAVVGEDPRDWMHHAKRRFAFEPGTLSGELGVWSPDRLLPYRFMSEFVALVAGERDASEWLERVLRGMAAADGVPEQARGNGLALRVIEGADEGLAVVKQFPPDEFLLHVAAPADRFTQGVADLLVLSHISGSPILSISLDLFELLRRADEGYRTGVTEQSALAEELAAFKNQLLARATRDVVLVEYGTRFSRVRSDGGAIQLEEIIQ